MHIHHLITMHIHHPHYHAHHPPPPGAAIYCIIMITGAAPRPNIPRGAHLFLFLENNMLIYVIFW